MRRGKHQQSQAHSHARTHSRMRAPRTHTAARMCARLTAACRRGEATGTAGGWGAQRTHCDMQRGVRVRRGKHRQSQAHSHARTRTRMRAPRTHTAPRMCARLTAASPRGEATGTAGGWGTRRTSCGTQRGVRVRRGKHRQSQAHSHARTRSRMRAPRTHTAPRMCARLTAASRRGEATGTAGGGARGARTAARSEECVCDGACTDRARHTATRAHAAA